GGPRARLLQRRRLDRRRGGDEARAPALGAERTPRAARLRRARGRLPRRDARRDGPRRGRGLSPAPRGGAPPVPARPARPRAPPPRDAGAAAGCGAALGGPRPRHGDRIAAVVLEPVVQGAAGMRLYDPAYLRAARALCDRCDVLLVFDEVFGGYGRTGPMW